MGWMDGWTDGVGGYGWMDGWMGWMDGWTYAYTLSMCWSYTNTIFTNVFFLDIRGRILAGLKSVQLYISFKYVNGALKKREM